MKTTIQALEAFSTEYLSELVAGSYSLFINTSEGADLYGEFRIE